MQAETLRTITIANAFVCKSRQALCYAGGVATQAKHKTISGKMAKAQFIGVPCHAVNFHPPNRQTILQRCERGFCPEMNTKPLTSNRVAVFASGITNIAIAFAAGFG